MNALGNLSFLRKLAGFVAALNVIPLVDPRLGVIVVAAAAILKNAVSRIVNVLGGGQPD